MKEKFDPKEYRDNLASLISSAPKSEKQDVLSANQETAVYRAAKDIHLGDIQDFLGKNNLSVSDLAEKVKESSYLQEKLFGKSYADSIDTWSDSGLRERVISAVAKILLRDGKVSEVAELYEREAPDVGNMLHPLLLRDNFWVRAGELREKMEDFDKAIEDYKKYVELVDAERIRQEKLEKKDRDFHPTVDGSEATFDILRCYSKKGSLAEMREIAGQRVRVLEDAEDVGDHEHHAQFLLLAGEDEKARKVMEPLGQVRAGVPYVHEVPMEIKMRDMDKGLRRMGFRKNPETGEWKWEVVSEKDEQ